MFLDLVFAILMVFAIFKGYSKGIIVAVLSVVGFIVGLAAALQLSVVVAKYFEQSLGYTAKWMPFLAFIVVMFAVMLIIRFLARALQKTFEKIMLGWANRLAGIVLFALIYSIVLSVVIFFLRQMQLVGDEPAKASVTYPYLKQLGPIVMDGITTVVPVFKDAFAELKAFFGRFKQ